MSTTNATIEVEKSTEETTEALDDQPDAKRRVLDGLKGVRDALTVKRVFDEPREIGGITVIPVARVSGGAGAGGGEGTATEDGSGSGFGTGFGLRATPVGIYEVRDSQLNWHPAVDVTRLGRAGMVLTGIIAVCVALVTWRRS